MNKNKLNPQAIKAINEYKKEIRGYKKEKQYFSLNPNFNLLIKYFSLYLTQEVFDEQEYYKKEKNYFYEEYYEVMKYNILAQATYYTLNNEVKYNEIKNLFNKYNLLEHLDTLLFAGLEINTHEYEKPEFIIKLEKYYMQIKEELNLLRLIVKYQKEQNHNFEISFNQKGIYEKSVITNKIIVALIENAIKGILLKENEYTFSPDGINKSLNDNDNRIIEEKLNKIFSKKKAGRKSEGYMKQWFFMDIQNYLEKETLLPKAKGKVISNKQAEFIYDFALLLNIIEKPKYDKINEEKANYVRSLTFNYIKKFKIE